MKKSIAILVFLGIAWNGTAAVVYRGRLALAERPQEIQSFSGTKTMTFRFYDDTGVQQGAAIVRDVPLERDGTFSVLLDSAELTENLEASRATQVGLTIGNAAKELRPLRKLLPMAQATEATRAAGLAAKAKVGRMTARDIVAKKLSVRGNLSVGGAIKPDDKDGTNGFDRVAYAVQLGEGAKLRSEIGGLCLLGEPIMLTPNFGSSKAVRAGQPIPDSNGKPVIAPEDGIATISCVDSLSEADIADGNGHFNNEVGDFFGSRYSANCLVVKFCRKGETIMVPDGWNWQPATSRYIRDAELKRFSVRFHPFVNANAE